MLQSILRSFQSYTKTPAGLWIPALQIKIGILLTLVFLFAYSSLEAQNRILSPDSTNIPQEEPEIDTALINLSKPELWQPDPKKALWFSLALPGLGQIYNRSWWKAPLIYGGLGVSIWFIQENHKNYKDFRTAYSESFDPNSENELVQKYPNQESLRRIRDIYYKRYQLSIIATAAVYLMNGIEAYVDAHLKNFEISDDLSLRWSYPQVAPVATGMNQTHTQVIPIMGITYTIK